MTLIAVLLLVCWLVAVIDMASEKESWWVRMVRDARRRARELKW